MMEIDEIINSELANESEPMEVAEVSNESSSSVIENSMEIGDEEQNISNKKNKYDIAQNESNNECFFLGPKGTDNSIMQPDVEYSPSAPLSQHLRTLYPPERLAYGWVQKYKVNKRIAIKSLLEVILRSTGIHDPPLTITPRNVKNLTIDMFDDWIKKSGCQPYVQNEDYEQKIHVFFGSIVRNMMSDFQLLQMLQGLLQVMHNSHYMSARFSAVIFETSILDAFSTRLVELKCKMGLVTGKSLKRMQRQHNTIDEYIRENSNIILHSFRDVRLLVRKCAFHIFKLLLHYFPSVFVHDFYLRATFWQLFDSTPTMRILAIQFCSSMLANSRFNTRLDVYSRKCVPELCKLTRDKNPKVTVEAIKALKLITSCSPRMMSNINLESTFLLVFCNQPTVATEAAWLICESFMKTSEGDTVTFLSAVIKFLHSSEVSLNCSCTAVFLEIMLPKAGFYLSNWKAWITLLTGDMYQGTPDLAVNACQLFTSVVRYTATGSLTSKVFLSIDEHFHSENETNDDKRVDCNDSQEQMTCIVQSSIIELWQKYEVNRQCLLPLLTVPQYFCYNPNIDFNTLSLKIMAVKPHSEAELEEMMINLACILKMINNSQEWKYLVTKIEQYLFDVAQNFLQIVREMVLDPDQMDTMNKLSSVLMIAHYTLKYFDMSQTEMRDGVFQALSLHVANNNSQLVKVYVAPMCLYMIEWQLKDLPSLIASNDRVAKLEQQVNDLVNALNRFLQATNSDTRTMAFKVLCRLLELFCENSEFIKGLPSSIQIQPSVQMIQWLNFNLNVLVPHNVTYTDSQKFQVAAKHLKRYCNLLSSGILDISYLSSVLPHFSLYLKDGNYNPVLRKLIEELSSNASLPSILIYSLANINIHQGQSPCKMIAEGLAHVLFSQLKEEDKLRNLNWDILYAGSSYILKNEEFSLLQPLSCFVKFITKDEAIKVKAQIVPLFSGVSNNTEVQQYLNSFPV